MALLIKSCPISDRNSARYQTERSSITELALLGGETSIIVEEEEPGMQSTFKAPKGMPILLHEAVGPLQVSDNEEHLLLVRVPNQPGDMLLD